MLSVYTLIKYDKSTCDEFNDVLSYKLIAIRGAKIAINKKI